MLDYIYANPETKHHLALAKRGKNFDRHLFSDLYLEHPQGLFDPLFLPKWGIQRIYNHELQLGGFADDWNNNYL